MNPFTEKICGVAILAGGQSQRMGQDKMLLKIGGETLLERAAKMARQVSDYVYVVGRDKPHDWPVLGVEFVNDDTPNQGPLGGLQTVLRRKPMILAIAGDLPKMTSDGLQWLFDKPVSKMGLIVENDGQWEPLFSIYTAQCLPLIEENLRQGKRSLHALIKAGDFDFITAPPEIQEQLFNVNTPTEWQTIVSGTA